MKKLLSALLIATMLIASVTCVLAVSAEDGTTDSNILANLMPEASENDNYSIVKNDDGSVTITLKTAGTETAPVKVEWTYAEGTSFTVTEDAPAAVVVLDLKANGATAIDDFNSNNTSITYDRKNHTGTGDLHFLNDTVKASKKEGTASTSYSFDVGTYLESHKDGAGAKDYYNEDHKYNISKAVVSLSGEVGSTVTIYSLAVVKTTDGLALGEGTPLVAPAVTEPSDDTSSDDSSAADTSSDDSSAADTSSDDSSAADTSSDDSSAADTSSDESSAVDTSSDESSAVDTSSDESSAASTSSAASSAASTSSAASSTPASSSSNSPTTGDTGLIVFVVLAVLATVGGVVIVRARH